MIKSDKCYSYVCMTRRVINSNHVKILQSFRNDEGSQMLIRYEYFVSFFEFSKYFSV